MEVRLVETFLKVAKLGNITKSADQLGYSQTAVTAQIKQLEANLGVQLFDRMGRSIQLTDAGKQFIPYAVALMKSSDEADAFGKMNKPIGEIRIQAGSSLSLVLLPGLISRFRKLYPEISVRVQTQDDVDKMLSELDQNRFDFMFVTNLHEHYKGCLVASERKEEFAFVTNPSDALAQAKNVKIEDIFSDEQMQTFVFCDRREGYGYSLESALMKRGIVIKSSVEFSSAAAIVNFISNGGGRSFLPVYVIEDAVKSGKLAIIDTEEIDINHWSMLYYNENRWLSLPMRVFINFIQDYTKSISGAAELTANLE